MWAADGVLVTAVAARHEPIVPAAAYRIDAPDGSVVVSGDTRVCVEVERLAAGADILVHEAVRPAGLPPHLAGLSYVDAIVAYHADSVELGALAARAGVGTLVLTHLLPQPQSDAEEAAFAADVRRGGFTGPVVVARDLSTVGT